VNNLHIIIYTNYTTN